MSPTFSTLDTVRHCYEQTTRSIVNVKKDNLRNNANESNTKYRNKGKTIFFVNPAQVESEFSLLLIKDDNFPNGKKIKGIFQPFELGSETSLIRSAVIN